MLKTGNISLQMQRNQYLPKLEMTGVRQMKNIQHLSINPNLSRLNDFNKSITPNIQQKNI